MQTLTITVNKITKRKQGEQTLAGKKGEETGCVALALTPATCPVYQPTCAVSGEQQHRIPMWWAERPLPSVKTEDCLFLCMRDGAFATTWDVTEQRITGGARFSS